MKSTRRVTTAFLLKDPTNTICDGIRPQIPHVRVPNSCQQITELFSNQHHDWEALRSVIRNVPIEERWNKRCSFGSFVEVIKDDSVRVGIVTRPQTGLFSNTAISMVTAEGDSVEFQAHEVSFHLAGLFDKDTLTEDEIPLLISNFMSASISLLKTHQHLMPVIQAWYTKDSRSVELDLLSVLSSVLFHSGKSKTQQECLLYAIHMYICSDPFNFRVQQKLTKPLLYSMTSDSIPMTYYFANSMDLAEDLREVSLFEYQILDGFNSCLKQLDNQESNILQKYKEAMEKDDAGFLDINMIVTFLMYYKIYPHPSLSFTVSRLLGDELPCSSSGVSQALERIGVSDTIFPSEIQYEPEPTLLKDNMKHIRVTNTSKVYLLPSEKLENLGLDMYSELGISLEKERDFWMFNIHVPDVGSQVPHISKSIGDVLQRVSDVDLHTKTDSLFSHDTLKSLAFHKDKECLAFTISIKYPLGTDKPWYKTSTTVRLERLVNVQYVPLHDLNELWRSRFPIFSELLSIFMSNDFRTLESNDRNILLNMINMIDYWCLKRGYECSMDQHFTKRPVSSSFQFIEGEYSSNFLDYVKLELSTIASHHLLQFSSKHSIPQIIQTQDVLPPLEDTFRVQASNLVIPQYDAHGYNELTFSKDSSGLTPISNYLAAISFLSPAKVGTTTGPYASLGLEDGFCDITTTLSDLESIANQWQIISYLQSQFVASQSDYKMGVSRLFMKGFKVKSSSELQRFYDINIRPAKEANADLQQRARKNAILRALRSEDEESWVFFKCIVLRHSKFPAPAKAYCSDLGIEVDVLLSQELPEVHCGDHLICNKVVSLTNDELWLQV